MASIQPTRRALIQACLAGAASKLTAETPPSVVAIARDPQLRAGLSSPDAARLTALLDRAVQTVYNADSPIAAWRQVARPGEIVGLKVNCLAGRGASTTVKLVEAVCEQLQQAGIPARNILIWDRLASDLDHAGFRLSSSSNGIRVMGNDELGYENELSVYGSAGSLLARALTQVCDCVINLPVLKDHGIVGVTMALKNLFGAIHNPNKYHTNAGDPYVADVYMLPSVRQKVRLHLCDGITAQYEGGPSYMPQWSWPFNGVLAARDPVALDCTGWQIIEAKRAEKGVPRLKAAGREPVYIATAADARHRIGTNDPARIARREV
jgi:uncharacterized protein (DUF362 family)